MLGNDQKCAVTDEFFKSFLHLEVETETLGGARDLRTKKQAKQ